MMLCSLLLAAACVAHPEMYSVRPYPRVLERDFWVYLSLDGFPNEQSGAPLAGHPLLTDSGVVYTGADAACRDDHVFRRITQEFGRTQHHLKAIESNYKLDKPFSLCISNRRNFKTVWAPVPEMDVAHYREWAAKHPNFYCFRSTGEIVNDVGSLVRQAAATNRWAKYRNNGDRYMTTKAVEDYYQTQVKLHYGDGSRCIGFRGYCYSADFITAAQGACALVGETTGTAGQNGGEWRWNVSPMFLRGAARQFNVPWMWYTALFVNGMKKDGTWQNESWPRVIDPPKDRPATDGGISASLYRRLNYFAYLVGANALEPEGLNCWGLMRDAKGSRVFSPHGEGLAELHAFSRAHPDRGQPYCPVALLVPYNQGYPATGGVPYSSYPREYAASDHQVDALFHTLMPGRDQQAAFREGREGFLRNSPFAQMYDVLVPDSPQSEDGFVKALSRYPVAILAGTYPKTIALRARLVRYLNAGGTLFVPKALAAAVPANYRGKGLVVFSESDWMTPPFTEKSLLATRLGQLEFPEMKALFAKLEAELFPYRVRGDVLYGLNRAKGHDWLWVLNNRGVRQWTDTKETIDASAAAEVKVSAESLGAASVKDLVSGKSIPVAGNAFSFTVPAGGLAVFEIAR